MAKNHYTGSTAQLKSLEASRKKLASMKEQCNWCKKSLSLQGVHHHQNNCFLNPKNVKFCPVCETPIKNYRFASTCSRSCSNRRYPRQPPTEKDYTKICFRYYPKQCIVCNEPHVLDVHHLDKNRENNSPENLIPLCPTHHAYMHRGLKHLIVNKIEKHPVRKKIIGAGTGI